MEFLDIIQYFTDKLNANSNGVVFEGGYLIQTVGDKYEYKQVTNYYTVDTVAYVPVTFGFVGEKVISPGDDITDWNIVVTMDLQGLYDTDPNLVAQVDSVNEFANGLSVNPLDTYNGYRLAIKPSPMTKTNHVTRGNGKRIEVFMELDVTTGIGIFFSNDITYTLALDGETPITLSLQNSTTILGATSITEADLNTNSAITTTTNQDGTVRYDLSKVYKNTNLDNELVKSLNGINKINTKFDYVEVWPTFSVTKKLVVSGGTIAKPINGIVIMNLQMVETDG